MEAYHKGEIDIVETYDSVSPWVVAKDETERLLKDLSDYSGIPSYLEPEFNIAPERAGKAVEYLCTKQPLQPDWTTIDAEMVLEKYGNARIDLLVSGFDSYIVVDYKSKVTTKPVYREQFEEENEYSWQLYHYVWSLRCMGYAVNQFAIALVVIEPKPKLYLRTYDVDEDYMSKWIHAASTYWKQMEAIENKEKLPTIAPTHADKYGKCPYYDYCFLYKQDWSAASFEYRKRDRD